MCSLRGFVPLGCEPAFHLDGCQIDWRLISVSPHVTVCGALFWSPTIRLALAIQIEPQHVEITTGCEQLDRQLVGVDVRTQNGTQVCWVLSETGEIQFRAPHVGFHERLDDRVGDPTSATQTLRGD